jgi:hypothetical protein
MVKEKLTPIRHYKPPRRPKASAEIDKGGEEPTADLSYIAEDLRPLAVPCTELAFLPVNPRCHGEKDLAALVESLREFGQVKNVVVNTAKEPPEIVAGNGTLRATLCLGRSHIARVRRKLSDAEAAAYAVLDNHTGDLSQWDKDALKVNLAFNAPDLGSESFAQIFADLRAKEFPPARPARQTQSEPPPGEVAPGTGTCPACNRPL